MASISESKKLSQLLQELVSISGLSGHEVEVNKFISNELKKNSLKSKTDILGN